MSPLHWTSLPGWYDWVSGTKEMVARFPDGSRFCETGLYLGRSVCALAAEIAHQGKDIAVVGVDTCRGTGVENGNDNHGDAVTNGRGTFAGELHRNVIGCGAADRVQILISDSVAAANLFPDEWFDWVNLDSSHEYAHVKMEIEAWLPKVRKGGWITGDDYCVVWPEVVKAVNELLPTASPWSHDSWRWIKR
jgi:hypothetical protein